MRSWFIAISVLGAALAAALVLASCAGTEDTTTTAAATTSLTQSEAGSDSATSTSTAVSETTTTTGGSTDDQSVAITATDELLFEPDALEMSPGQQVELTFRNAGSVQHSFALLKADSELEHVLSETDEEHLHEELYFDIHEQDGGESVTETFTAPSEPGEYMFACLVPGHAEAGMVGTLTVR